MFEVGHQIGGYTVVRLIGKGGMSEVYLGQHRRVARRAAIKVLIPELSQKAAIVDRFFSEARATSLIRHPGIVEVIDCDVHQGQAFIVMELLEGESLGEYLRRTGPLSRDLGLAIGVGVNVARAVGAAHELKVATIIHRDLKPDNIFLHLPGDDRHVVVKVLDFGIAKLAEQGGISHTSTSVLMGTPSYMSPEQCRGAKAVDARSDIYSLGCVLYEALAGTPPFVREGVGDLIIAHVSEAPAPLGSLVPGLPARLGAAIARMMAKRPEDRSASMSVVADDLLAVAAELGLPVGAPIQPHAPVHKPAELARATLVMPASSDPEVTTKAAGFHPGGTQVMSGVEAPATKSTTTPTTTHTTTLGSAAREIAREAHVAGRDRRWRWVLGVGSVATLLAIAAIVVRLAGGGGSPPPSPRPAAHDPGSTLPTAAREPSPPAARVATPEPERVTISLSGVPPGSAILLDGVSSSVPLHVAKGPEIHRILVRAPGGAERVLEVNASADRILDVGSLDGPPAKSPHPRPLATRPPAAAPPATRAPKSKPSRGVAAPEAITDI